MSRNNLIKQLAKLSRQVGADFFLSQAGGGNASIKSKDSSRIWIKASGLRLSEVTTRRGIVELNLNRLNAILHRVQKSPHARRAVHEKFMREIYKAVRVKNPLRPSLETGVHIPLDRVVMHAHPIYVNAINCMRGGEAVLKRIWRGPVMWVKYEPPGHALAIEVQNNVARYVKKHRSTPSTIFLKNHGFISAGPTTTMVSRNANDVLRKLKTYFGTLPARYLHRVKPRKELADWAKQLELELNKNKLKACVKPAGFLGFGALRHIYKNPRSIKPLIPDDVVFCGHGILNCPKNKTPQAWLQSQKQSHWPPSVIIAVQGRGLVFMGTHEKIVGMTEDFFSSHVVPRMASYSSAWPVECLF